MADKKNDPEAKVPWHFWLTLVAVVGYLGYRVLQGVSFIVG